MSRRWRVLLAVAIWMVMFGAVASAGPSVVITQPRNGTILTTHDVNVTGTVSMSDTKWFQGSASEFGQGTLKNVTIDSGGAAVLSTSPSDDFEDDSLNTSTWNDLDSGGGKTSLGNGYLNQEGTVETAGGNYHEQARVSTCSTVKSRVAVQIASFTGSGSGYRAHINFIQDVSNYVQMGIHYEKSLYARTYIEWGYTKGGSGVGTRLQDAGTGPYDFLITYTGGTARVYLNGVEKGSVSISLSNIYCILLASGKGTGDTFDAQWDDFCTDYASPGTLESPVHDSKDARPEMKRVDWNATTSSICKVSLQMRSSNASDMSSPTSWTSVTSGQSSGFPTVYRYLQYRANLTSDVTYNTPALKNVSIFYRRSLASVEVSTDDGGSWTPVNGTTGWFANLALPENTSYIKARAIDTGGDSSTSTVRVEVDTTPPRGSVLIEDGREYAPDQDVTLDLFATDRYGVRQVMVDDYPDFPEGYWRSYSQSVRWHLPWGDGSKTVYVKFMDSNGWESPVVSDTIFLDTQPPEGSVVINGGAEYTNATAVSVSLTATDLTGVTDMLVGFTPSLMDAKWTPFVSGLQLDLGHGDGEKRVYAAFRDRLGHVCAPVSDSIVLDSTPPRLELSIADGAPYTSIPRVLLSLEAFERFCTTSIQMGEDPDLTGAALLPFAPSSEWTFSAADGTKVLYARAWDAAGNVGAVATDSILLDTVPPLVMLIINGGHALTPTRDVSVALDATDELQVTAMRLGEDAALAGAAAMRFSTPIAWTLSDGDGPKTLYARVVDAAGNEGPIASATITLDTTPPALRMSVGPSSGYTPVRSVLVELEATDSSPIAMMQLGEDPKLEGATLEPFFSSVSWLLSAGDGAKALYARVFDLAGNGGGIVRAPITLDTTPPTFSLTIEGGATFTSGRLVSVQVDAYDARGVLAILLGDSPSIGSLGPFCSTASSHALPGPDGLKVVYGSAMDRAGNLAPLASASIILDTTPPTAVMRAIQPIVGTLRAQVSWGGSDALSGVRTYDLQSRDGDGPWRDWLSGTESTEAEFLGTDGHTYSFRVRAVDAAGNAGAYTGTVGDGVTLSLPPPPVPTVTITSPLQDATVRGIVFVSGTAGHQDASRSIVSVKVMVGEGTWLEANGTSVWSVGLDTTLFGDGPQTIKVRAFDGQRYSEETVRGVVVDNPPEVQPSSVSQGTVLTVLLVLVATVAGVAVAYGLSRRRARG